MLQNKINQEQTLLPLWIVLGSSMLGALISVPLLTIGNSQSCGSSMVAAPCGGTLAAFFGCIGLGALIALVACYRFKVKKSIVFIVPILQIMFLIAGSYIHSKLTG